VKAYEFSAQPTPEGKLQLPETIAQNLSTNQTVRVILLIDEPTDIEENAAWSQLTAEQFFSGYGEEDAIYDQL
jgi:hypothetical protein